MEHKFTISEVFSTSWKSLKEQIWVLVGLCIGYMILSMMLSMFVMPAQGSVVGSIIVNILLWIFSGIFFLGYLKNIFQALDGEEPQFSAYGQQARKIVTYLLTSLLLSIIVMIGTVFLIIPGIYLALRLQYCLPCIVEENTGVIDSLKKSWNITQGHVLKLLLLALTMIGISLIGLILFGIGIFVAVPLIYTMYCYSFRKLNTIDLTPTDTNL